MVFTRLAPKVVSDRSPVCMPRGGPAALWGGPRKSDRWIRLARSDATEPVRRAASPAAAVEDRNTNPHLSCLDQDAELPHAAL